MFSVQGAFLLAIYSNLAIAAGATFVARWTTYQARSLKNSIKKAIEHKGFSFIEVISQCPVQYGKVVGMRNDSVSMLMHYKECSVNIRKAKNMSEDELKDKIIEVELVEKKNVPELTDEIKRLRREAKRK